MGLFVYLMGSSLSITEVASRPGLGQFHFGAKNCAGKNTVFFFFSPAVTVFQYLLYYLSQEIRST